MSLWLVVLIVFVADALALTAMLLVRRRAPDGSFVRDSEQVSATINVAGTVLAVLIGFVFLIAFESYGKARSNSQDEASATTALFHTAEAFPAADRNRIQGNAICYARAVIHGDFGHTAGGTGLADRWTQTLEHAFERVRVSGAAGAAAEQNFFLQSDARQKARQGRLAQASPLIPTAIWFLLILGSLAVIVFVLSFADIGERKAVQTGLIVVVTTVLTAALLTIAFLDDPYGDHEGAIFPTAMRSTLSSMEHEQATRHPAPVPCGPDGRPTA